MTGGCACGRVRYTVTVEPEEAYLCHCRMCQRATGSVSIAFATFPLDGISWERDPTGTTARRSRSGHIAVSAARRWGSFSRTTLTGWN
jgi:hypothetical protein